MRSEQQNVGISIGNPFTLQSTRLIKADRLNWHAEA
jgi:hypothetical protein